MALKHKRSPNYSTPYIVYRNGLWWLFRNRWKSQYHFRYPQTGVACLSAPTIHLLTEKLRRSKDWRMGCAYLKPWRAP